MGAIPRKVKKALGKWTKGLPLSPREADRLHALFWRNRLSRNVTRFDRPSQESCEMREFE